MIRRLSLLLLWVLLPATGCQKTAFDQEQVRAEAANPHWLEIDLDTLDHRHTYKESEFFGFQVGYSSAVRELYKAEVSEDWSTIVFTDRLHVSNGLVSSMRVYGIVCCGSRTIGLNDEPYVTKPRLRLHLKPGTYKMYVTTRRVFPWSINSQVYQPSEWVSASNMLKIRVVDDPGWQERALARVQANPKDQRTCGVLGMLDIPAATARKLENIRNDIRCPFHGGSPFSEAFNESEYPSALKGLDQIVHSPSHGVVQSEVNTVLHLEMWLAHPELRYTPDDRDEYEKYENLTRPIFLDIEKAFVRDLCATLPAKLPDARKITQHTIDGLTENKLAGIPPCQ